MGVNTIITLPFRARVKDVADVIGILSGCKPERYSIERSTGVFVRVPGVRVEGIDSMPECARIYIDGATVDAEYQSFHVLFHHDGPSGRMLYPCASDFWIAIGRQLIEFFGGSIVYNDCGEEQPDETRPEQPDIHSEDGDEWNRFQLRKLALKPITKKDLKAAAPVAAYK